ncbi:MULTISPECIES: TetR/AcrR family transcriptional regulator [unclassified Methylobacterium]|uniref:TetR/AcrR family transcriptional regulator n=1 Tax=unclassified Methylobacterium TaxID=2615210 RepID=UPI0006F74DDD|nr:MULTISPECIES: TetR/AcrR family transcriptional regulator [unclassified Methylobacterium]KQO58122.1 TetR family transcriptional regulator [Methylobacterium sp. Leaf86]KQO97180.1 TetR family transcriptional regulator [Methylobacterium sp. Leaf91]
MDKHLDTVKSSKDVGTTEAAAYHHGDLRAALIHATTAILRERGIDGFSLREAARRAGVSPAAPQHHFGDARGLLTAVATEGFRMLGDALAAADSTATDRDRRIRGQGRAYIGFALDHPAEFDTMWRCARINTGDAAYAAAAGRAFGLLKAAVAGTPFEDGGLPAVSNHTAPDPKAVACWSVVHGLARLALDGALGPAEAARGVIDGMLEPILDCLTV